MLNSQRLKKGQQNYLSLFAILTALLLALSVFAAAPVGAQADDEVTILFPVDFASFDPNTVTSLPNTNVLQNVLETLVDRNREPLLAESWELVDDTTWEFRLREGVEFTNGEAFNADVVKFSIERIQREDNENTAAQGLFSGAIAAVEVVDEHTVRIITQQPSPTLLDLLIDAYMVPPGVVDDPDFDANGVGTGPYVLEDRSVGEAITLTRSEDYWGDAPFFSRVTYRSVPEPSVRTTEVRAGNADIIVQVPTEELGRLDEAGIEVVEIPSTQAMRIHLNANLPPFDDARMRQAVNYAIDRELILETLLEGAGRLMASAASPGMFGFNPDIDVYPFDPERARELMEEAGFGDGVDIIIQFTEGRYVRDRAIGEAITAQLADVGINVNANFSEFSQWLQLFNTEGNGFMVTAQEDNVTVLYGPNFACESESFKRYGYCNAEVDRLIAAASVELDSEQREALYRELNQVLHDDPPWVFMWNPLDIYAIRDDISGFAPNGVGFFYAKDLARG